MARSKMRKVTLMGLFFCVSLGYALTGRLKEVLQLGWPDTFANDSICIGALYDLIEKIEEKLLEAK